MKRKTWWIAFVIIILCLLATAAAASAGQREVRLVCRSEPVVIVRQGAARWIVSIVGDCVRPAEAGAPAPGASAPRESSPSTTGSAPYPEPTFEPYPYPEGWYGR